MTKQVQPMPTPVAVNVGDDAYPREVARLLGAKTPKTLYCRGNLALLGRTGIGFCGSRKASVKGLAVAEDCAGQIAKAGLAVVSGYAAGVDFSAHRAALEAGGTTVMVLPEGIENFRVRKNLADVWDWNRVLVISQFPPAAGWKVYHAMERNLLIIAFSRAMVVIEAGATGGTLHAGKSTLKLGLPLYVVEYGDMTTEAPGNAELLALGGTAVRKSQERGIANVSSMITAATRPVVRQTLREGMLPMVCPAT